MSRRNIATRTELCRKLGFDLHRWAFHRELATWNFALGLQNSFLRRTAFSTKKLVEQLRVIESPRSHDKARVLAQLAFSYPEEGFCEELLEHVNAFNRLELDDSMSESHRSQACNMITIPIEAQVNSVFDLFDQDDRQVIGAGFQAADPCYPTPVWRHLIPPSEGMHLRDEAAADGSPKRAEPGFGQVRVPNPSPLCWPLWTIARARPIRHRLAVIEQQPESPAGTSSRANDAADPKRLEYLDLHFERTQQDTVRVSRGGITIDLHPLQAKFILGLASEVQGLKPGEMRPYKHFFNCWATYGSCEDPTSMDSVRSHVQNLVSALSERCSQLRIEIRNQRKVGYRLISLPDPPPRF